MSNQKKYLSGFEEKLSNSIIGLEAICEKDIEDMKSYLHSEEGYYLQEKLFNEGESALSDVSRELNGALIRLKKLKERVESDQRSKMNKWERVIGIKKVEQIEDYVVKKSVRLPETLKNFILVFELMLITSLHDLPKNLNDSSWVRFIVNRPEFSDKLKLPTDRTLRAWFKEYMHEREKMR